MPKKEFEFIDLNHFFELNIDLLSIADLTGRFIKLNPAWEWTLGYSREELMESQFFDFVHPDDISKTEQAMSKLAENKKVSSFINRYKKKDGSYCHLEWSAVPYDSFIYATARDVSQALHLEESIQTQKELLSEMGGMASIGAWELDAFTFKTKWTDEIYKIYELPPDYDANAEDGISFYHPEDRETISTAVNRVLNEGQSFDLKLRLIPTSGKTKWVRAVGKPFYKDDKVTKVIGTFQDITEQALNEFAYEESIMELLKIKSELQNYKSALDQTAIVSLTDADGIIIDLNHNFSTISGYSKEELLGKSHNIINSGYHSAEFFKDMWKTIKSGKIWRGEIKNRTKQGNYYWVSTSIIPFLNSEGIPKEYYSIRFDITNAKKSAQLVLEAKEAAEAANKAKTDFLSNMSHEIRTPLNSVIGFTELLIDTNLDKEQKEFVRDANTSAKSLLGIINDVLDFSKIEAGKLELESQQTFVYPLLNDCIQIVSINAKKKGLQLTLDTSDQLPETIFIDPTRVKQVLVNLLGNAIKFTEFGSVVLEVRYKANKSEEPSQISFKVIDSGIGISDEQKGRLFQVFSQADNSITRKFGGTGLGLAISSKLVEQMGGELSLSSKFGVGSVFEFSLPIIKTNEQSSVSLTNSKSSENTKSYQSLNRLLVVEDNPLNAKLVETMLLKMYPSLQISFASNGEESIQRQAENPSELILMDLHMPVMDGVTATTLIRESEKSTNRHVIIIALTAGASADEKEACIRAGMDDFLTKPIISIKLQEMITKYFN